MRRVEVGAEEFGDPPFIAATPSPTSSSDPIILVTPRIIHSGSPIYGSDACFLCFVIECHGSGLNVILEPSSRLNSDLNRFLTMPQYYL